MNRPIYPGGLLLLLGVFLSAWLHAQQYSVEWNSVDSISSGGDSLICDNTVAGWYSINSMNQGEDKEFSTVEFSIPNDSIQKKLFLETAIDVGGDFGFHFSNDQVFIVDDGTYSLAGVVTSYTTYKLVRTTSETVEFYLDGNLTQTSTAVLQGEVFVQAGFARSTYFYDLTTNFQRTWSTCWDGRENVSVEPYQTLTSNDPSTNWESGAISYQITQANLDDYLVFSQDSTLSGEVGIGLSQSSADHDWTNIDYCYYFDLDAQDVSVCTTGTVLHTISSYTAGDYFRIERNANSGSIDFLYNGVEVYSLSDPGGTYVYDICFSDSGQSLNGLKISLGCGEIHSGYYGVQGQGRNQRSALAQEGTVKVTWNNPYDQPETYIIYQLLDEDRTVLASVDDTGAPVGNAPQIEAHAGENYLNMDFSSVTGFESGASYWLEISNTKGEKINYHIVYP